MKKGLASILIGALLVALIALAVFALQSPDIARSALGVQVPDLALQITIAIAVGIFGLVLGIALFGKSGRRKSGQHNWKKPKSNKAPKSNKTEERPWHKKSHVHRHGHTAKHGQKTVHRHKHKHGTGYHGHNIDNRSERYHEHRSHQML